MQQKPKTRKFREKRKKTTFFSRVFVKSAGRVASLFKAGSLQKKIKIFLPSSLLEEVSFQASKYAGQKIQIDKKYVNEKLEDLSTSEDLSRYVL